MNLTKQEIFDKAVRGVIAQGGPSLDTKGGCAYRSDSGRKCAAGFLIEDKEYDEGFEGGIVLGHGLSTTGIPKDDKVREALVASGIDPANFDLISDLQGAHDDIADPANGDAGFMEIFTAEAERIAHKHGLTFADSST